MWNEFFLEYQARQRHQAHLRETLHERLAEEAGMSLQPMPLGLRLPRSVLELASIVAVIGLGAGRQTCRRAGVFGSQSSG